MKYVLAAALLSLLCMPRAAMAECDFSPAFYRNLSHIYIVIDYDSRYVDAMKCKGHEEDCARKLVSPSTAALTEDQMKAYAYTTDLFKKMYQNFPEVLSKEALTETFEKQVIESVAEFTKGRKCNLPVPVLLTKDPFHLQPQDDKDSLIVTLHFQVNKPPEDTMGALALSYFRSDAGYADYYNSLPWVMAIPLENPQIPLASLVEKFILDGLRRPGVPLSEYDNPDHDAPDTVAPSIFGGIPLRQ